MLGYLVIAVGALMCALVLFQLVSLSLRSLAVARQGRTQRDLLQEVLKTQIEILKERHREQEDLNTLSWNGYRKFIVKSIRRENKLVSSFSLVPHDGKKLPPFKPGQFLTFNLRIPGFDKPVVRCYSLSDAPGRDYYRVTIKKIPPNPKSPESKPGLSSTYFNELVKEGDILDVKAPSGSFFLDMHEKNPVVLIGGGIGVTPIFSMLQAIADRREDRETWFFYGVRNNEELVLKEDVLEIVARNPHIKLFFCISDPPTKDDESTEHHVRDRVSIDLFKKILPSNNYDFLICGPPPMMEALTHGLKDWGVPETKIHFEAFGFATVKKTSAPADSKAAGPKLKVKFARSNSVGEWDEKVTSLLDLAEANKISIASGCRAGNCGTCVVAVKAGSVKYLHEPGFKPDAGTCLACVAVPACDLEIDA